MDANAEKLKMQNAVLSRDHRFDGRFFVGIKTTGIYCRPICPARPKPENMEFFPSAAHAERAGFRPCLRCRPEVAPFSPAWIGKSAVVKRAIKRISDGGLFEKSEKEFADSFGLTSRHLRRLFVDEIGITPKQLSDVQRLNFARLLAIETSFPMTEIAFSTGFTSLRRFNDAFQKRFKRSPTQIRASSKGKASSRGEIKLSLAYRPPYDWDSVLAHLKSHAVYGAEDFSGEGAYKRYFLDEFTSQLASVTVTHDAAKHCLNLVVTEATPQSLFSLCKKIRRMFDLDFDPLLIADPFESSPMLAKLYRKHPGLRLPRGWDGLEVAVNTVLGQLVSVAHARALMTDLIKSHGSMRVDSGTGREIWFFPSAATLSTADLAAVKTTTRRKEALRTLGRLMTEQKLRWDDAQDLELFREALAGIKGIGPWTIEYICMRGLGDTDALPKLDLIIARVLERHPEINPEAFSPWRSYLTLYLWKEFAALYSKTSKGKKNDANLQD